jgi:non-ribosomal peptide synthetase component F
MYTSGSTGRPRSVAVSHRNIVRLVRNQNYVEIEAGDVFLQYAPISFDAATFEIYGALLNGGRLVVYAGAEGSLSGLGEELRRHGVTILWLTAGLFHLMVEERIEDLKGLKQLLAGGDVLNGEAVWRAQEQLTGCKVINGYGPTECTTFSCCHRVKEGLRGVTARSTLWMRR